MESEREQIWDLSTGQTEPYKKLSSIPKLYLEMYGERQEKKLCCEWKSWQVAQPSREPKNCSLARGQTVSANYSNTSWQKTAIK